MSKQQDGSEDEAAATAETEQLKRELFALGAIDIGIAEDLAPEQQNQSLRRVLAFETGAATTLLAELQRIGIDVPPPAALSDAALTDKLWEIIDALGRLGAFLHQTDHLSDRALYELLHDRLLGEMNELGTDDGVAWHIDVLGGGSAEISRCT